MKPACIDRARGVIDTGGVSAEKCQLCFGDQRVCECDHEVIIGAVQVEPSSVCHRAGLQVGHRLIEVNGDSLLGCDQSEAAAILRSSNELRILVCDGYNVSHAPRIDDRGITSSVSMFKRGLQTSYIF